MRRSFAVTNGALACLMAAGWLSVASALAANAAEYPSHPPCRPMPQVSDRPLGSGPCLFVDAAKGNDAATGDAGAPWRTISRALKGLNPGATLVLRGGTYYERVTLRDMGVAGKTITLRSHPGELAVIDGGLREFHDSPAASWEPCPDGVMGEYRSVKSYPLPNAHPGVTNAWGRFGDSMVSLHGYRLRTDLQCDSMFWPPAPDPKAVKAGQATAEPPVYCGPGVWYNTETQRIHVRLAHTNLVGLGENNYRGETDPRRLRLVVALRGGPVIDIEDCRNVALQDLVVRGAVDSCIDLDGARDIALEGLTLYGGGRAVRASFTSGLRMKDCALRGPAAPWVFRSALKYRAVEAALLSATGSRHPVDNADFDISCCEFTDSCDCIQIGNVAGVKLHHCLIDNVSDDGIELTNGTTYDGRTPGGNVEIFQNRISRVLTPLSFGVGHGRQKTLAEVKTEVRPGKVVSLNVKQVGAGMWVYRNVFDQRQWVLYFPPGGPTVAQELTDYGRTCGDHGDPVWEPMRVYQNLFVTMDPAWRDYYGACLTQSMGGGAMRRIFNNIFVQAQGLPGFYFEDGQADLAVDGNLFWSAADGPGYKGDVFAKFRASKTYADSRARYEPGWTAHDLFADPKFVRYDADWRKPVDLTLQAGSPAAGAGLPLPADWPDPLRAEGRGNPDVGPLPVGARPWGVGVRGRCNPFTECK